jgi:hypothetical protein
MVCKALGRRQFAVTDFFEDTTNPSNQCIAERERFLTCGVTLKKWLLSCSRLKELQVAKLEDTSRLNTIKYSHTVFVIIFKVYCNRAPLYCSFQMHLLQRLQKYQYNKYLRKNSKRSLLPSHLYSCK